MQHRLVNARQLEVLGWIADGCPDGVMSDSSYKTTSAALKNRGLAAVSKHGGWHATLTDAGRHYLDHGRYPDDEASSAKPAVQSTRPTPPTPKTQGATGTDTGLRRDAKLREPEPEPMAPLPSRTVPVPQRLTSPHPLAVELKTRGRFEVSKDLIPRALRIVHALAVAFEAQGWTVSAAGDSRDRWGHSWDAKDLFVVDTGEYKEGLRVREENDRTRHEPTAYELKEKQRWSYTSIPEYDYHPSGRIFIEIHSSFHGGRYRWSDRQRWTLEEKLGQVVDAIEVRSEEERERRIRREAAEAERKTKIDLAVEVAKVDLRESHREKVLLQQVDAWQQANQVRAYLAAMADSSARIEDPEAAAQAESWLQWCRLRMSSLDPLEGTIAFPADPEPTAEAIRPFLPDWMRRGW